MTYASTASAATHTINWGTTPVSGNLLILTAVSDATITTPTGWTLANSAVDFSGTYIFYKTAGASEGNISVSPTSSDCLAAVAFEYSGMAASGQLDKTASATGQGTATSVSTGTTATTTQSSELLIAVAGTTTAVGNGTGQLVSSWNNSFAIEANATPTGSTLNTRNGTASRTVSATGTYTTTATIGGTGSGHDSGIIAAFKASGAARQKILSQAVNRAASW